VGVLDELIEDLATSPPGSRLFLISDERVATLHGERLCGRLSERGLSVDLLTFPQGEASKSREQKARLEDRLLSLGAGRDSALIAVGGGVTGDLSGFVAATWHRGVPVVQVPTSLLSMADAALGGKTAINLGAGKNLVGAFHQPLGVYADVAVLATLDEGRYVEGFAEVVKAAVVGDAKLFRWLEKNVEPLLARDPEALEHAIGECMRIKGRVVARDEREAGRRAILNFGHTIAHALEARTGYTMHHGQAVAVGMCVESRIARRVTGLSAGHVARLDRLLERFGLPTRPPTEMTATDLLGATRHDKKARGGQVRYALPRELGRMLPGDDVAVIVDDVTVEAAWGEVAGTTRKGSDSTPPPPVD